MTSSSRCLDPAVGVARVQRVKGNATSHGPEFEWKVAGTVALRAFRKGLHFQVFTNVKEARPCDDLVVRFLGPPEKLLRPVTFFMQLKHARPSAKRQWVTTQEFIKSDGDFAIKRYFEAYERMRSLQQRSDLSEDEQFLADSFKGDVQFGLYTNKSVKDNHSSAKKQSLFLEELFNTSVTQNQEVFSFTSEHLEVWNLIDDESRKIVYQKYFLPKLQVFSQQSNVDNLDSILHNEIECTYNGDSKFFFENFTSLLKKWAQDPQQNFALCDKLIQQHLHVTLAQELRSRAEKSACSEELNFNAQSLESLRTVLRSRDLRLQLCLRGAPEPGRRAAKLLQVLKNDFEGAWLYVDAHILRDVSPGALAAVAGACAEVIVIDVLEGSHDELRAHNLIETSVGKTLAVLFRSEAGEATWQDEWRLRDLTPASQSVLLQRTVDFQGKIMALADLYTIWPSLYEDVTADLLLGLERNENPQIGSHFPCPEEEMLPRSLEHHSAVSVEALVVLGLQGSHLALSGFPTAILNEMARYLNTMGGSTDRSKARSESAIAENDKWTVLREEGEFSFLSGKERLRSLARNLGTQTIHHLEYVSGDCLKDLVMLWRDTFSQNEDADWRAMRPLVQKATDRCTTECICSHHSASDLYSLTSALLVGEAGVGKTTLMECIASEIKEKYAAHWVVIVRILQHRDLLRKWQKEELTIHHAVELLASAARVTGAARNSLAAALQCEGGVSVFVDGVDEVVPVFKDHAVGLLEILQQDTKTTRVWATSRPEVETELRRTLRSVPLALRPLTPMQQRQILCSRWGTRDQWEAEAFAERVVEWLAEEAGGLLAIPLHLQMLTEVFGPDDWLRHQRIPLEKTFSLLELYDKFVEKKRQLFRERHFKDVLLENLPFDDRFMERHENCSIYCLFSDEEYGDDLPLHGMKEFIKQNEDIAKGKEKSGILWKDKDGRVNFIHQTFAEYFASKWLWRNCCCNHTSTDGARRLLRRLYKERDQERTKRMKLFLVEMLKNKWPVHAAVWKCDLKTLNNLLHPNERSTEWEVKDSLFRWTAAEYMKWTFGSRDLLAGSKQSTGSRKPWLASALTMAAKGGYERVVQEILHLADLADRKFTARDYRKPAVERMASKSNASDIVSNVEHIPEKTSSIHSTKEKKIGPILKQNESAEFKVENYKIFPICTNESNTDGHSQTTRRYEDHEEIETGISNSDDSDQSTCEAVVINDKSKTNFSAQNKCISSKAYTSKKSTHQTPTKTMHFGEFKMTSIFRLRKMFSNLSNRRTSSSALDVQSSVLQQPSISSSALLLALRLAAQGDTNTYTAVVNTLLNYGVADNTKGDTALHEAARVGNMGTIELLLRKTETINARNEKGHTPLTYALGWIDSTHRHRVAQRLLCEENIAVNMEDVSGWTPLSHALLIDCKECVYSLLQKGSDVNGSNAKPPMLVAVGLKRMDIIRFLIEHGANVNAADKHGFTPLHSAAEKGFVDVIDLLLSYGALINSAVDMGWTPLHGAALLDHTAALRHLLAYGANTNLTDKKGRNSLHAVAMGSATTETTKELLSQGADASATDDQGRTPLDIAFYHMDGYSKAEQYIIAWNVLQYAVKTKNPNCFNHLLRNGVDVNTTGPEGESLLHRVARRGIPRGVELLLRQGANVHLKDSRGRTPLVVALQRAKWQCAKILLEVQFT